jgi:RimJ/RimL family protein N-acetyltransferase
VTDSGPAETVRLRAVDEETLERMLAAALSGAAANEVAAPVTPGEQWTPERVEWMRQLHRDSRPGLAGPAGQATWAAVRLKRTTEPDVLETGIWLTRSARGRRVARTAIADVLEHAREHGARRVRADTSRGNSPALSVLQRLGFRCEPRGDRVVAVCELT